MAKHEAAAARSPDWILTQKLASNLSGYGQPVLAGEHSLEHHQDADDTEQQLTHVKREDQEDGVKVWLWRKKRRPAACLWRRRSGAAWAAENARIYLPERLNYNDGGNPYSICKQGSIYL
jgi:hypothetical protein